MCLEYSEPKVGETSFFAEFSSYGSPPFCTTPGRRGQGSDLGGKPELAKWPMGFSFFDFRKKRARPARATVAGNSTRLCNAQFFKSSWPLFIAANLNVRDRTSRVTRCPQLRWQFKPGSNA